MYRHYRQGNYSNVLISWIRLELWDYFCWKDVIFFQDKTQQYTGAVLRVYRGDPEEYWTFITPEACKALSLYKEEWKSRFLKYPANDDPLIASTRFDVPVRLKSKGVRSRVDKIVTKIGLRDGIKKKPETVRGKTRSWIQKIFNTMMRRAKVNYLDKEDMMGHKIGLEQAYERYQEEDFERFPEYQKAIPFLTISNTERLRLEAAEKQEDIEKLEQKDEVIQNLHDRINNLEYGLEARRSQYEKDRLAGDNSLTSRFFSLTIPLWFEGRTSESEKKKTWKKFKKENLSRKEITEALGESKGLSWDNISESVKQFEEDQSKENMLE